MTNTIKTIEIVRTTVGIHTDKVTIITIKTRDTTKVMGNITIKKKDSPDNNMVEITILEVATTNTKTNK
jgi:hypothetical protein